MPVGQEHRSCHPSGDASGRSRPSPSFPSPRRRAGAIGDLILLTYRGVGGRLGEGKDDLNEVETEAATQPPSQMARRTFVNDNRATIVTPPEASAWSW